MRLLIFEPEAIGHQMEYIRYILDELRQRAPAARVTLLTSEAGALHPNCQRLVARYPAFLEVEVYRERAGRNRLLARVSQFYERQRQAAANLAYFLRRRRHEFDFALVPHMECIGLPQLAVRRWLFKNLPWATVSIAARFHHRSVGIESQSWAIDMLQRIFFNVVVRDPWLRCFGSIDPYFVDAAASPKIAARMAYCPDPCAPPEAGNAEAARAYYGIRPQSCVVAVFGFLDHRKCIASLLAGAARVDPALDLTVLLAGTQHTVLKPALASDAAGLLRAQNRLIEVNHFILIGQDPDPLLACDISWVFYEENFVFSSSVLVRSALRRRAVIARKRGIVGRQVSGHKIGLALGSDDPDEIAKALTLLATNPALRREMGENGAREFAGHTPANFAAPVVRAILGEGR